MSAQPESWKFVGRERQLCPRPDNLAYAQLVGEWAPNIGLDRLKFDTHSLRRTRTAIRTGILLNQQVAEDAKSLTSGAMPALALPRAGENPK
jgi:hypothetical protein